MRCLCAWLMGILADQHEFALNLNLKTGDYGRLVRSTCGDECMSSLCRNRALGRQGYGRLARSIVAVSTYQCENVWLNN